MKKSQWISALIMLAITGGVYFLIYQQDIEKRIKAIDEKRIATSEGLVKIFIQTDKENIKLEYINDQWMLFEPHQYPANSEFLERSLTVMNQVLADATFPYDLNKDEYGFKESFLILRLTYSDGTRKELVLGSKEAPGSQIYLLDKFKNIVYVVHNVWGQFFYYDGQTFLSPNLAIKSWDILGLEWKQKDKILWSADRDGNSWVVNLGGTSYELKHEKLIWWLQGIKKWEVKPTQFNKEAPKWETQLTIVGNREEEVFLLNPDKGEIYISSLKAFAELDPFLLKSLERDLKKVIESEKK